MPRCCLAALDVGRREGGEEEARLAASLHIHEPSLAHRSAMPPASSSQGGSALSRTVASLTRAALGANAPSAEQVGDVDLDKYVADLILKEARERNGGIGTSSGGREAADS